MPLNLNNLHSEMQKHLKDTGMVVFQSVPRSGDQISGVYWDSARHPDYQEFVAAAAAAGVRMMTLCALEFRTEVIDDALDQLKECQLERDERRAIEMRLREMLGYEGFTCQIELSFDHAQKTYILDLTTDWFDDLNELIERIGDSLDDAEDENPLTGYFSNN